jgi:hypothetical protein
MKYVLIACTCTGLLIASVPAAYAQRYPWNDRVIPSAAADVSLDEATGDFMYRYTLANGLSAEQRIHLLRLDMSVTASAVAAPVGWSIMYQPGQTEILWSATGALHLDWQPLHGADAASYASEVAPGHSLSGFEVRSPCAVATVRYRTRGYNHMRLLEHDTVGSVEPDTPENSVGGTVIGPGDCDTVLEWGNRRRATDGFMGVVNFASGATLPAGPVAVQIRFSRSGEQVDRSTFSATLNQQDVTAAFRSNSRDDLVAVFQPGTAPLRQGRNVLLLSVDGIVPGTTRTGTDADRITFTVP